MRNDNLEPSTPARRRRIDEDQVSAVLAGLEAGFADDPAAVSGVAVVTGSGVKLKVERGHLVASDGEGWFRRERSWNRATGGLRRLLIRADSGYLTLDALAWCRARNVAVLILDNDGEVALAPGSYGVDDARLRRIQAAPPAGVDVEAARLLLRPKLLGQSAVLRDRLDNPEIGETISGLADALDDADSVDACRQLEASAAACYWSGWTAHPATTLRFATADAARLPTHWATFDGRRSLLSKGVTARKADRPLNALLNLNYRLAEVEARLACTAVGLDVAIGFVHTDMPRRASLALDLLETIRPTVDRFVLDIVAERTFVRYDFVERSDGSIRIAPRLVQECAAAMPAFARTIAPHAEALTHLLGRAVAGKWQPTTKLTSRKSRAAQAEVKARKVASEYRNRSAGSTNAAEQRRRVDQSALFASCLRCGAQLTRSRHLYCEACQDQTPGHAREARRRRGQAIAATRAKLDQWQAEHPNAKGEPEAFRRDVLPGLATVKLAEIMKACGISKASASTIRSGKHTPALRHWDALARLAEATSLSYRAPSPSG